MPGGRLAPGQPSAILAITSVRTARRAGRTAASCAAQALIAAYSAICTYGMDVSSRTAGRRAERIGHGQPERDLGADAEPDGRRRHEQRLGQQRAGIIN
jgi:hypothetical protein